MKFFKYLSVCCMLFLLHCGEENDRRRSPYDSYRGDRRADKRGYFPDENSRSAEIRRLRSPKVVSSEVERRFDGGFYYEGFGGPDCEESEACKAICEDRILSRTRNRYRCYKSPRSLVESLEDGFFKLLNISVGKSVDISPGLIAGMLDIDVDIIADLVEKRMSKGDLRSFLAWVAINEGIAEVFLEEDRRSEVMENAFKELGKLQTDARREMETGLNTGLIQDEDTFFHLAALEGNEAAFQIAYEILESVCSSRSCKLEVLCARDFQTRRRSRFFGNESRFLKCRTSASQGRRMRSEATCYIHGAAAWSYLDELIEDREIRDNDFEGEENQITVETCNAYCGDEESGKCEKLR